MLVLSRKVGEKIVVDDNVTIVINRISGQRVSIGIEAPRGMRVVRSELRPRDDLAGHHLDDGFSDPTGASVVSADIGVDAKR
ncbi:MAG TPA: carbon storage regulator [Pirellulales bacterium]|jgi:carbon storage regulator CsrA|nr:carbon storage regulator [Pirellulales bacterium]